MRKRLFKISAAGAAIFVIVSMATFWMGGRVSVAPKEAARETRDASPGERNLII